MGSTSAPASDAFSLCLRRPLVSRAEARHAPSVDRHDEVLPPSITKLSYTKADPQVSLQEEGSLLQ